MRLLINIFMFITLSYLLIIVILKIIISFLILYQLLICMQQRCHLNLNSNTEYLIRQIQY